ncbi:hypothetical protein [Aeromonas sp. MdU4]|uniref:hypothetical protein n=1 Tax=Aeromonas sp. MdU4 TaxID=3342819 RepID=UPI0035B75B14
MTVLIITSLPKGLVPKATTGSAHLAPAPAPAATAVLPSPAEVPAQGSRSIPRLVKGAAGEFVQRHQLAIGEWCLVVTVGRFNRSQLGRAVLAWFFVVLLAPQLIAMPDCPPVGDHHQPYQPVDPPRRGTGDQIRGLLAEFGIVMPIGIHLHIPADHEHQFRFNVNTISGPM